MKQLFLESNWLFDIAAPRFLRKPAALRLLDDANGGRIAIHLPALCLGEARRSILKKCQPKGQALQEFRRWAKDQGRVSAEESHLAVRFLELYNREIVDDLQGVAARLRDIASTPGVHVYALDDAMLEQAIDLEVTHKLELKPFDESILAAVLVRARALRDAGHDEICFCELDGHLKPWDKNGPRNELQALYDEARVWVYGDYQLAYPSRPAGWP